jgi:hypothetical protein
MNAAGYDPVSVTGQVAGGARPYRKYASLAYRRIMRWLLK